MLEHNNEHTFNLKEKERKRIERQKREEKERGCIIVYTISLLAVQNQIQSIYFVQKPTSGSTRYGNSYLGKTAETNTHI